LDAKAQPTPSPAEPGPRAAAVAAGSPVILVAARNEADRIGATLAALSAAFPGAHVVVGDDASTDGTAEEAMRAGAEVVSRGRPHGTGANMTAAAYTVLERASADGPVFLLCDGDLGASAAGLTALVEAVETGECELAVAAFSRRLGGGFGLALGFARWAIRRRCGARPLAPISGQRALTAAAFRDVVPFAAGYGMEVGMTIDAVRAGHRLREYELDLEHRASGRSLRGFLHRGRQLLDFARAYRSRRRG
jgi:glycosyltransferase involved in cell wall biosynthesis